MENENSPEDQAYESARDNEYRDYLDKQAKEFAREKVIAEIENEDPNDTEGRDVRPRVK